MTTEKELLQKPLENILIEKDIPYIHIPNSSFRKNLQTPPQLKDFPDIMFPWEGKIYIIELGIKVGNTYRNKDRKIRQYQKALKWFNHLKENCVIHQFFNRTNMLVFLKNIGVIKTIDMYL